MRVFSLPTIKLTPVSAAAPVRLIWNVLVEKDRHGKGRLIYDAGRLIAQKQLCRIRRGDRGRARRWFGGGSAQA